MSTFPKGLAFPKPPPAAAVPQSAGCHLAMRVPTCGLHAKGITVGKGGKRRTYDLPELVRAKALYAQHIPHLPAPVAGPLVLHVDFVLTPRKFYTPFEGVVPFAGKPDRSNLVKLFEDCLAAAGWMTNDQEVVAHPGGKWLSLDPELQGVWFVLETLSKADDRATFKPPFPIGDGGPKSRRRVMKFLWHGPAAVAWS